MTEHTPTPWIIEEGMHWLSVCRTDSPIEHGQRKAIVATRWSGQVTDEERTNVACIIEAVNHHHLLVQHLRRLAIHACDDDALTLLDGLNGAVGGSGT